MDKIESIQYQAALSLTGAWKGTNTDKIYDEVGWEPLTERRRFLRRLVQFFKIQNDLTPEYLKLPDVYPVLTSMVPAVGIPYHPFRAE